MVDKARDSGGSESKGGQVAAAGKKMGWNMDQDHMHCMDEGVIEGGLMHGSSSTS